MAIKPQVRVTQVSTTPSIALSDAQLESVIVGPNYVNVTPGKDGSEATFSVPYHSLYDLRGATNRESGPPDTDYNNEVFVEDNVPKTKEKNARIDAANAKYDVVNWYTPWPQLASEDDEGTKVDANDGVRLNEVMGEATSGRCNLTAGSNIMKVTSEGYYTAGVSPTPPIAGWALRTVFGTYNDFDAVVPGFEAAAGTETKQMHYDLEVNTIGVHFGSKTVEGSAFTRSVVPYLIIYNPDTKAYFITKPKVNSKVGTLSDGTKSVLVDPSVPYTDTGDTTRPANNAAQGGGGWGDSDTVAPNGNIPGWFADADKIVLEDFPSIEGNNLVWFYAHKFSVSNFARRINRGGATGLDRFSDMDPDTDFLIPQDPSLYTIVTSDFEDTNRSVTHDIVEASWGTKVEVDGSTQRFTTVIDKVQALDLKFPTGPSRARITYKIPKTGIALFKAVTIGTPYSVTDFEPIISKVDKFVSVAGMDQPVKIAFAEITLDARLLITDEANKLGTLNLNKDIEDKLGEINKENPIALAAFLALSNTGTRTRYMTISSDDVIGYAKAFDALGGYELINAVIPLTQNVIVNHLLKEIVTQLATPDKSNFMIGMVNEAFPGSTLIIPPSNQKHEDRVLRIYDALVSSQYVDVGDPSVSHTELLNPTATYKEIDSYTWLNPKKTYIVRVLKVPNMKDGVTHVDLGIWSIFPPTNTLRIILDTQLEDGDRKTPPTERNRFTEQHPDGGVVFSVEEFFGTTKRTIAKAISLRAKSYGTKRIIYTWPDLVQVQYTETDQNGEVSTVLADVPGFYLNAAYSGVLSGTQPHQSLTNYNIAGITKLYNSSDYFKDELLDIIQQGTDNLGGVFLVVQDVPGAAPYCRRQLTTGDQLILQEKELSIVRTVDYLSKYFKALLVPYVGNYNLTPQVKELIGTVLAGGITYQKNRRVDKLGATILSGSVTKIATSSVSLDTLLVELTLEVARPLNFIDLTIKF